MGFKRALLERSLKAEDIFTDPYRVMDLSENLKLFRDGLHAAAAGAAPESLKQFSDFSINKILNSSTSNSSGSDNEDVVDYRMHSRASVKTVLKSVELIGMDLSSHFSGTASATPPPPGLIPPITTRPLNRVFESPWSSKVPIVFTPPKINSLQNNQHHHHYDAISQTLITVHQSAQNYTFNFNNPGNELPIHPAVAGANLSHLLYHPATALGNRQHGGGGLLKSDKCDLIMPPTATLVAARDLDYCYMPTPSSAALLSSLRPPPTTPQLPPSTSSAATSPAYNCPCKQCELRALSLNSEAPSVDEAAAVATGLFNFKSRYECEECGKGFSQLRNYKYHLSIHKGTREFAAHCPECGKMFNDKGYLSSHLKIHRNRKEYACPHCPKSFNQRVAFNMHVRIHTGIKPHKCPEPDCSKRFSRKMLLKQHLRTHTGEKPYQCTICSKTFADRSNMTLHQRLHSGIKPFSCPICPKAFTKKHHLKTHLNYHTGFKPYKCPHKNCGQCFTQSSNMRTHAKKCQFKPPE